MLATQKWMDTVTNNLANVSTNGFKRDGLAFSDALETEIRAAGGMGQSIGTLGSGTTPAEAYTSFEVGPMQSTGRPLDVAIDAESGMFAVQTPDGIRYTRDGSFTLNDQRELVTKDGFQVLDQNERPITLSAGTPSVDAGGQITVDGQSVGTIGVYDGIFQKEGSNLYASSNPTADSAPSLKPQTLEGSNVNAVQTMVEMIQIGRLFELSQKSIQQQDDLSQRLIQSLSTR